MVKKTKMVLSGVSKSGELRAFVSIDNTKHQNWFLGELIGINLDGSIEYSLCILDLGIETAFGEFYLFPEHQYRDENLTRDEMEEIIDQLIFTKEINYNLKKTKILESPPSQNTGFNWDRESNEGGLKQLSIIVRQYNY